MASPVVRHEPRGGEKAVPRLFTLLGGKHLIDSFADELRDGFGPACRQRLEKLVLACFELDLGADHDGISALEAMNGKFPGSDLASPAASIASRRRSGKDKRSR